MFMFNVQDLGAALETKGLRLHNVTMVARSGGDHSNKYRVNCLTAFVPSYLVDETFGAGEYREGPSVLDSAWTRWYLGQVGVEIEDSLKGKVVHNYAHAPWWETYKQEKSEW